MKTIQLIINPCAGRGEGARTGPEIARSLSQAGFDCEARITNERGHAIELARRASEGGADCVAIAGGDGSISEVVNGLMQAGGKTPLAIMPVGTGNDFHKMLKTRDWHEVIDSIRAGSTVAMDVGRCNERYFSNGIGIGFDAKVARLANEIRWLSGNAVYGVALAKTLMFHHDNPQVRITTDNLNFMQPITMLAAANGRVYGGSFRIAPNASIHDGLLDVVIANGFTRGQILKLVPHVMKGTHLNLPGVQHLQTRTLKIQSHVDLPVHADGEMLTGNTTELEIEILPGALPLVN